MTRRAIALLLTLLALSSAGDARAQSGRGSGGVLVVGDSLEVLTSPYLRRYLRGIPVTFNFKGGFSSPALYKLFREAYDPSQSVIVFDAGTNDNPAYPQILAGRLAAVARAVGDRCMVVPTIKGLRNYPSARKNQVVAQFAASRPGTQTPDWQSIASSRPDLMQPDHLHPNIHGADVRARLIARAVKACLGLGGSLGPPLQPGSTPAPPARPVTPAPTPSPEPRSKRPRRRRAPQPEEPPKPPPTLGNSSPVTLDQPVAFTSSGVGLKGELITPGGGGRHPAVVMLGGSGRAVREAYREQAEFLATHGVGALIFDKRGSGESGGDPDYSYAQLAADGRAAVSLLASRPEVDPRGIGVWGFGEGGSIAPEVAAENPAVAAVLVVSPAVVSPASQRDWAARNQLAEGGAGSGTGAVSTYYSVAADAGDAVSNRAGDLSFQPPPVWRRVSQPVLAVWGADDRIVPLRASATALAAALAAGANEERILQTFPGADHSLGVRSEAFRPGSAPGFKGLSASWLREHLAHKRDSGVTSTVVSIRLPPADAVPVRTVADTSPLERWPVQLAWLVLPALVLLGVALRAWWRRRGEAEKERPGRGWWWAGGVVALDLATLGALAYAVAHIVETGGVGVSALAGMPLPIAVTWLLTGISLVATAVLARRVIAARGAETPRGPGVAVPLASAVWLLLALYWLV